MESTLISPTGNRDGVNENDLTKLVEWFEEAEDATEEARKRSERDRDYYDGKQLTEDEINALSKRGQPDIIINRIKPKVDFLLGLESQQRADPKAFPRNPDDEEAAHAATDALRYVNDKENLDQVYSGNWEDMLIPGMTGVEVHVREGQDGRKEIDIKRWAFDRVFYDPHSSRHDFSDARYMGGVVWMDADQAEALFGDKAKDIQATVSDTNNHAFKDKPSSKIWVKGDDKRARVRVVQIYWLDGSTWKWAIFTKGVILDGGVSPYVDEEGGSENPMLMQSAYVDRENQRYGVVRSLIGPQDEINKRRSKLLHMLSVRQFAHERGALDDVDAAKRELARPDGDVELNPGFRFEILSNQDQTAGQAQLLAEAKGEIESLGPNAALQGKAGNEASGRAILASQQGGIVELSVLTDRHRHLKRRVYRAIWNRIRQFWDDERWVRVTDNEDNLRFVGFNRQTTVADEFVRQLMDQEGLSREEALAEVEKAAAANPNTNFEDPITVNVPADMDMDILIEEAPDTVTLQQEQFEQLAAMAQSGVPIPPDVLIRASSLRNKDELLERLEQASQRSEADQLALIEKQAGIDKTVSETEKNRSQALKNMEEVEEKDRAQAAPPDLPLADVSNTGPA